MADAIDWIVQVADQIVRALANIVGSRCANAASKSNSGAVGGLAHRPEACGGSQFTSQLLESYV